MPQAPSRPVFVYGTLRRGGRNDINRLRPPPEYVGMGEVQGVLYHFDWYPGLTLGGEEAVTVVGEVYRIGPELEAVLDGIEQVVDSAENVKLGVVPVIAQLICMYRPLTCSCLTTVPVAVIAAKVSFVPSTEPKLVPSSDHWTSRAIDGDVPDTADTLTSRSITEPPDSASAPEFPDVVRAAEETKVNGPATAAPSGGARQDPA